MQLSISCVLGQHWVLETYRDELYAQGWVHTFELSRYPAPGYDWPLEPLNNAIVAIDAWDTFHYLPHGGDTSHAITLRFRTEADALWAKMVLHG